MKGKRGLTLIELVAALAIVSLLMAVVLATALNLSRAEAANSSRFVRYRAAEGVKQVLARDLEHAGSWQPAPNGFTLLTLAALDPKTNDFSHRQAEVTYDVRKIGSRQYLLRTQRLASGKPFTELVSADVSSVSLNVSAASAAPVSTPGSASVPVPANAWKLLPPMATVSVGFDSGGVQFSFHTGGSP